jgi:type IV pilus assembly protein PilY1
VDTDNDGFVDTAYVGDLGGNMWRFKFCTKVDGSGCGTGNWLTLTGGGLLFQASSGRPIYTAPTVSRGDGGSLWVFWGTGDRENPVSTSGQDSFFAVKDDRTSTYTISNLQDISTEGTIYNGTRAGWYINFPSGTGEKDLSDPTVFGGIVMFTTYTPNTADTNVCNRVGSSKLYAMAMMRVAITSNRVSYRYDAGAGVLSTPGSPSSTTGGSRSITLGTGMAQSPVVSQNPVPGNPTDIYLTLSGGASTSTSIISGAQLGSSPLTDRLKTTAPSSQVIHWRDGRLQ